MSTSSCVSDLDRVRLAWLNKRYSLEPPKYGVSGNDGVIFKRPTAGYNLRAFDAIDLLRGVAKHANMKEGLNGFGVTEPRCSGQRCDGHVVALYVIVDSWMLGIEHEYCEW